MDLTYSNMVNLVQDDQNPLLLEDYLNSLFIQPLAFYNGKTLQQAIDVIIQKRSGIIQIPPTETYNQVCYIVSHIVSSGEVAINAITYSKSYPVDSTFKRPFSYDGSNSWKTGDVIYSTDPANTRCLGWVCVQGGTPGLWHTLGRASVWKSEIETVSVLPEPTLEQSGRQVLFAENGQIASLHYCVPYTDKTTGNTKYRWSSINELMSPYYASFVSAGSGNIWKTLTLGFSDVENDLSNSYKSVLEQQFVMLFRIPRNSEDNQRVQIGGTIYALKFPNGNSVRKGDLMAGSMITAQVDTYTETMTVAGMSLREQKENSPFYKASSEQDEEFWRITTIGANTISNTSDNFKEDLQNEIAILFKIPANSLTGQKLKIGTSVFDVLYADGTSILENDFRKDSVVSALLDMENDTMFIMGGSSRNLVLAASAEIDSTRWKITKAGEYLFDTTEKNLENLNPVTELILKAPEDSIKNQEISIGNKIFSLKYSDGNLVRKRDILSGKEISIIFDFNEETATLSGISKGFLQGAFATAVENEGAWDITELDGRAVPEEFYDQHLISFQVPSDSINNQKLKFGYLLLPLVFLFTGESVRENDILKGSFIEVLISPHDSNIAYVLKKDEFSSLKMYKGKLVVAENAENSSLYSNKKSLVATEIAKFPIDPERDMKEAFGNNFILMARLPEVLVSGYLHIGNASLELRYSDGNPIYPGEMQFNETLVILVNLGAEKGTLILPSPPVSKISGFSVKSENGWLLERIQSSGHRTLWERDASIELRDSVKGFWMKAPADFEENTPLIVDGENFSILYMNGIPLKTTDLKQGVEARFFLDTIKKVAYVVSSPKSVFYQASVSENEGIWEIQSIEGLSPSDFDYPESFSILFIVPENSLREQKLKINGTAYSIVTPDGKALNLNALKKDSPAIILVANNKAVALSGGTGINSSAFSASLTRTEDGFWKISEIAGNYIENVEDTKVLLGQTKFTILVRTPANSLSNQVIQIGNQTYSLRKPDGELLGRGEIKEDSLLTIGIDFDRDYATLQSWGGGSSSVTESNVYVQKDELGQGRHVAFSDDRRTVTESYEDGSVKVTNFQEDGSIFQKMTYKDGSTATKLTVFNPDGSVTETVSGNRYSEGGIMQFTDAEILSAFEDAVNQFNISKFYQNLEPVVQFTDEDIENAVSRAINEFKGE